MRQTEHEARAADLRELAGRLYRNLDARDGRVYWRANVPRILNTWFMSVCAQSPYTAADLYELYHVLHKLCGLVLDATDGSGQVTMQAIEDVAVQCMWADLDDAKLLRWLQDDVSRVALVDEHLEAGGVLDATRLAQGNFRRDMARTLLAALNERAASELAAWPGV